MKKNPILLYLLWLPFSVFGQQAYKGQLDVTDQHLSVRGGDLHVGMKVSYDHLKLPSDESLTLIPVLRSGDRSLELPSVVVNGTVKQRAYHRSEVLASASRKQVDLATPALVVRNTPKDSRQLTYKTEVPYAEWMKDAVLILRTRECGCSGNPVCLRKKAPVMPQKAESAKDRAEGAHRLKCFTRRNAMPNEAYSYLHWCEKATFRNNLLTIHAFVGLRKNAALAARPQWLRWHMGF